MAAHGFAMHPELSCEVDAVVGGCDNRLIRDGYYFRRVEGTQLPFDDASFDVVM